MAIFQGDGKAIFVVFVGAIVAAVLIGAIATQVNLETNTFAIVNETTTLGAVNVSVDLTGREFIEGTDRIINDSDDTINDYHENGINIETITSATTGLRTVAVTVNDTNVSMASHTANISYEYRPDGYISTAGGRSITNLIVLFSALAIVIFVIVVFIKHGAMGELIRGK